jgi:hypothetical protein
MRAAGEYVTGATIVAALKLKTSEDITRADATAASANLVVEHVVGNRGVAEHLLGDPECVAEPALTIALDLWRRPSTPGGYFQVSDYVGRLAQDPAAPVLAQLAMFRESWPVA